MAERPAPRGHRDDPAYSLFRNIPCRSPGCNRWFCNNAGLTKHMRAKHSFVRLQERPIPHPWELNDFPNPHPEDVDGTTDEGHALEEGEVELREWEHHSLLCGVYYLLSARLTCSVSVFHSDAMR